MAEAAEITPSEESLLSEKLSIGKVDYDVNLTSQSLTFTKYVGKTGTPQHRVIQLTDIITIQLPKEAEDTSLTLCFIEKKATWRYTKTLFKGTDAQTCKAIAEMVMQAVHNSAPERPKRLLVIVNPKSGGNKGQKIHEKQVLPLLQLAGVDAVSLITERAGHGREYVQEFDLSSVDGVLVVGGDGTLAEIVDGLFRWKCHAESLNIDDKDVQLSPLGVRVGIIPAGTGQGVAMAAYGTVDVETAVLQSIQGKTFKHSVYTCHNAGRCLSVGDLLVSHGVFSYAIEQSETKRNLGKARYGIGLGKAFLRLPRFTAEVQYKLANPAKSQQNHDKNGDAAMGATADLEPGWESVSGEFTDVSTFLLMGAKGAEGDVPPNTVSLHMISTHSRIHFTKFSTKLLRMQPIHDMEGVKCKYVTAFRLIIKEVKREKKEDQNDLITVINLDGDPFPITDPTIDLKIHGKVLDMFGINPDDWASNVFKKMVNHYTE